jgi:hypothetical protein
MQATSRAELRKIDPVLLGRDAQGQGLGRGTAVGAVPPLRRLEVQLDEPVRGEAGAHLGELDAAREPAAAALVKSRPGSREEDGAVGQPTTPQQDRLPAAEEVFAERVAPLLELVERWRARIVAEAGSWPAVPLSELEPDDPRRLLVAAEERVRGAAALRRRMLGLPDGEPGP